MLCQHFVFHFSMVNDEDMAESLSVEMFKPKFFFRKELIGRTSLPLFSIRHSNKVSRQFEYCQVVTPHSPSFPFPSAVQ